MGRKKKIYETGIQQNMFQESNVMSLEDYLKENQPKKKKNYKEKKFQGKISDILNQLGLVWIHLKNKCLNRFYHECPHCRNKSLVTCHSTINKEATGFPDILIIAGGLELKARRYGVKTAKLRKGAQKDTCEYLDTKIPIKCINEESQEELMTFLKDMMFKIKGESI